MLDMVLRHQAVGEEVWRAVSREVKCMEPLEAWWIYSEGTRVSG